MKYKNRIKMKPAGQIMAEGNLRREKTKNHRLGITIGMGLIACASLGAALANTMFDSHSKSIEIAELKNNIKMSEQITERLMEKSLTNRSFKIKVTGYHPDSGGINSDSNPNMTATMTPHKAGRTCAISTELVEAGWLGKEIYVEGFGMVIANDRLAIEIKGRQIDLCKGSYKDAMAVGVNTDVLAAVVNRNTIKIMMEE